ncbi:MATE family efflux transporter [Endozoicomonas sp.]|uniref:MATE family efflux transporter n=1 Tax=Endozoicomonas sp. TaxID=1892382 RepID=UPI003AF68453
MASIDLRNDPIPSSFLHYLLPAVSGMVVKSLYVMVDSIMVGRGVGADALAALSLTVPFFALFLALALMIGVGGAALMSTQFGRGNRVEGQTIFNQSVLMTLLISGFLVTVGFIWLDELVLMTGASESLFSMTKDYLEIMLMFFMVYALGWVLSCFVRNDGNPRLAMYSLVASALTNVVLDYLFIFVFPWGVKGAALATGLSQLVLLAGVLIHFIGGRGELRIRFNLIGGNWVGRIFNTGLPTFFIESTVGVSTLIFNWVLIRQGGDLYVTAYSIVINVAVLVLFVLMGIGQACQPIISFNHGANAVSRVRDTLLLGIKCAIGVGVAALMVASMATGWLVELFVVDYPELFQLASLAMPLYFLAFPCMAVNLMIASLFQAVEKPMLATALSIGRGFGFVLIGLVVMPRIIPEYGIWLVVPFAEMITLLFSLVLYNRHVAQVNKMSLVVLNT